jgi:hypothetical protein
MANVKTSGGKVVLANGRVRCACCGDISGLLAVKYECSAQIGINLTLTDGAASIDWGDDSSTTAYSGVTAMKSYDEDCGTWIEAIRDSSKTRNAVINVSGSGSSGAPPFGTLEQFRIVADGVEVWSFGPATSGHRAADYPNWLGDTEAVEPSAIPSAVLRLPNAKTVDFFLRENANGFPVLPGPQYSPFASHTGGSSWYYDVRFPDGQRFVDKNTAGFKYSPPSGNQYWATQGKRGVETKVFTWSRPPIPAGYRIATLPENAVIYLALISYNTRGLNSILSGGSIRVMDGNTVLATYPLNLQSNNSPLSPYPFDSKSVDGVPFMLMNQWRRPVTIEVAGEGLYLEDSLAYKIVDLGNPVDGGIDNEGEPCPSPLTCANGLIRKVVGTDANGCPVYACVKGPTLCGEPLACPPGSTSFGNIKDVNGCVSPDCRTPVQGAGGGGGGGLDGDGGGGLDGADGLDGSDGLDKPRKPPCEAAKIFIEGLTKSVVGAPANAPCFDSDAVPPYTAQYGFTLRLGDAPSKCAEGIYWVTLNVNGKTTRTTMSPGDADSYSVAVTQTLGGDVQVSANAYLPIKKIQSNDVKTDKFPEECLACDGCGSLQETFGATSFGYALTIDGSNRSGVLSGSECSASNSSTWPSVVGIGVVKTNNACRLLVNAQELGTWCVTDVGGSVPLTANTTLPITISLTGTKTCDIPLDSNPPVSTPVSGSITIS